MIPDGLLWNEAEIDHNSALNDGLVSLHIITDGQPQPIGTAFVVEANGDHAVAITAAHCLEEITKISNPHPNHHSSMLPEFRVRPSELDLKSVKAIYLSNGEVFVCSVEIAIWDNASDFAALRISAPKDAGHIFRVNFMLDDQLPAVGDLVAMIGIGEMQLVPHPTEHNRGKFGRRLVVRCGRVEHVHSEGHLLLKAPCIETTIAVYGGMSGGVVARIVPGDDQIKPFALISHAPHPQPTHDRSMSGHSTATIIKMFRQATRENQQTASIFLHDIRVGRLTTDQR